MTSVIQRMLGALYPKTEIRGLMVGLDASGRTTALYKMKLGEIVTTIPTIGFNVETVTYEGVDFTLWDVGGCDKIRPLWRHYFQNTSALFFFVDSNDIERMPEAGEELRRIAAEPDLKGAPIVVMANKQDLPNVRLSDEVARAMRISEVTTSPCVCLPCCAKNGEGLFEALHWALEAQKSRPPPLSQPAEVKQLKPKEAEMEGLLLSWLEREDEPDNDFIGKLRDYTLDTWDHRTHLRIAWLFLQQEGRRKGMQLIFDSIRGFIENSPRTKRSRGTTFHETMTYFWAHMVHYAMSSTNNPDGTFKTFLLLNPQLVNGGMFLHFYSKNLMLNSPESRTTVVLPDIRPLPSLISDVGTLKSCLAAPGAARVAPQSMPGVGPSFPDVASENEEQSDDLFIKKFEENALDRWSHAYLLRAIFAYVSRDGRKRGSEAVIRELRRIEKDSFHFTIAWFWIQIVDMAIAEERTAAGPVNATMGTPPALKQPTSMQISTKENTASSALEAEVAQQETATSSLPPAEETSSSGGAGFGTIPFKAFEPSDGPGGRRMREALSDAKLYLHYYSTDLIFSHKAAVEFVLPDKKSLPSLVGGEGSRRTSTSIFGSLFQKQSV